MAEWWATPADYLLPEGVHLCGAPLRHPARVDWLAWSPSGEYLAAQCMDGRVHVWNVAAVELVGRFWPPAHLRMRQQPGLRGVRWESDSVFVACTDWLRWWCDVNTGDTGAVAVSETPLEASRAFDGVNGRPQEVTLPGMVIRGSADGTLSVINAHGVETQRLEGHSGPIGSLTISPDGELLATRSHDNALILWRIDGWRMLGALRLPGGVHQWNNPVAFHPRTRRLACAAAHDCDIAVIDFEELALAGDSAARHLRTAKVVLLGDTGVGKTGLSWRLAHGQFREHASSHGEQFWVLPADVTPPGQDAVHREIVLWDLAGQPDYRIVHALSVEDADLALLVFNPASHEDPLGGVEYWLRAFAGRERPCPLILVGARVDRGYSTVDPDDLARFCQRHGIGGGMVLTSARTGEGVPALVDRIIHTLPWADMPPIATTELFHRIREYLLRAKQDEATDQIILTVEELVKRMVQPGDSGTVLAQEVAPVIVTLAKHGFIRRLRLPSGEPAVLLRPELLNNLASSLVIKARGNPRGLGAISETEITAGNVPLDETHHLSEFEAQVLRDNALALLLQHNICFRETTAEDTYLVFPSLITARWAAIANDDKKHVEFASYNITGRVENVFAAVVILLGYTNMFSRDSQWQNHATFTTREGRLCGMAARTPADGELELTLFAEPATTDAERRLFSAVVETCLSGRPITVERLIHTPCSGCGRPHDPIAERTAARGNQIIFCTSCGHKDTVDPMTTLNQRGAPGRTVSNAGIGSSRRLAHREHEAAELRTAFEEALVQIKAWRRETKGEPPECFLCYTRHPDTDSDVARLATQLREAGIKVHWDETDNAEIGASISRFAWLIESAGNVIVVGTPALRTACENQSDHGRVVAHEIDLVSRRLTVGNEDAKRRIRPVLLRGDEQQSFPPPLRGRVYADLRDSDHYLAGLMDLILSIHELPFDDPAIEHARATLRQRRPGPTAR